MSQEPIVMEYSYNAPIEKVWAAITDSNQMMQWYFNVPGFRPEVSFEFTFTGGTEENTYLHLCKITEVIPHQKLSHTWSYEGYAGTSHLTWELFPEGNGTRVVLTHAALETFPPINDFKKENFVAGWTHILGISLKDHLEKQS